MKAERPLAQFEHPSIEVRIRGKSPQISELLGIKECTEPPLCINSRQAATDIRIPVKSL